MCTTTFVRHGCSKCNHLIKFDQLEEDCEHKRKNLTGKCEIAIKSKDETEGSRGCPECLKKAKKKAKGVV